MHPSAVLDQQAHVPGRGSTLLPRLALAFFLLLAALPAAAENAPPILVSPARTWVANNQVSANWALLSVTCNDDGGEANLVYTWAATSSPAGSTVTFDTNGANDSRFTTAIFTKAGSYVCRVTASDQGGLSVSSSVTVIVVQSFTSLDVSPATASVAANGSQAFTASAIDQFGDAVSPAPAFTWTVSGGGTIAASGLFSAAAVAGGPFTVTATTQGKSGTAAVTVTVASSSNPGDTNGDKVVNIVDLINVKQALGSSSGQTGFNAAADFNSDGVVNIQDLITVKSLLGTSYP